MVPNIYGDNVYCGCDHEQRDDSSRHSSANPDLSNKPHLGSYDICGCDNHSNGAFDSADDSDYDSDRGYNGADNCYNAYYANGALACECDDSGDAAHEHVAYCDAMNHDAATDVC